MGLSQDPTLVAAHRPERELASRWGIYSARRDRWIDVMFASRKEAEEAIGILNGAGPRVRVRPRS